MIIFMSGGITNTNQEARPPADPQDYADPVRRATAFDQEILTRRRHNPDVGISGLWGSPFNRRRLTVWIVLVGACITRGQQASSRRGSAPMRTAWTTWSGCAGPAGSSASAAATPVAGG